MLYIFRTLAAAVSIYSLLCTIRIILTWVPGANYSPFGRFLSSICDPFLNLFSGTRWLRFGALDFSPIAALAVLAMASYMLENLSRGGRLSIAAIIAMLIQMAWSIAASVISFLIIVVIIRLIVFLTGSDRNSMLWSQIDGTLNPFIYSITRFVSGGRPVAYKSALIVAIIILLVMRLGGSVVVSGLIRMCLMIPV